VPDDVVEPLGVNDQLHAWVQGDPRLGGRVVLLLAQDEHRLLSGVVELEPRPDDPAAAVRIQAVVVIAVKLPQGGCLVAGIQLDHTYAAKVSADTFDVPAQARGQLAVLRPDAVLVRLTVIPETAAIQLAGRRRERREVRVAPALPVQVGKRLPLSRSYGRTLPVPHDRVSGVREDIELAMHVILPLCALSARIQISRAPCPGNGRGNLGRYISQLT